MAEEQPSKQVNEVTETGFDSGLEIPRFEEEPIPPARDKRAARIEQLRADDTMGGGAPWISRDGVVHGFGNNKLIWDKYADGRGTLCAMIDDPADPRLSLQADLFEVKNVPQASVSVPLSRFQFDGKVFNPKVQDGQAANMVNNFPLTLSRPPAHVTGWVRGLLIAVKILQTALEGSENS